MASLRYAAKFDLFLSLDCARVEGMEAHLANLIRQTCLELIHHAILVQLFCSRHASERATNLWTACNTSSSVLPACMVTALMRFKIPAADLLRSSTMDSDALRFSIVFSLVAVLGLLGIQRLVDGVLSFLVHRK